MRSPEVARAIPELVRRGVLPPDAAVTPLRQASGELLSIRGELRAALYLGVLVAMSGVSLLVRQNLDRIGPVTIAVALALAAAACLAWTLHRAPPFDWGISPSPDWSFDYLLLFGILLAGADLAFVEAKFTPLGENWQYHLLVMSLLTGALAIRCDSRLVWSLALATFTAWRGIAASRLGSDLFGQDSAALRWNLVVCGLLFVVVGLLLRRLERKAHFEPATSFLGALLVLAGVGLRALDSRGSWILWALIFLVLALALGAVALRYRRFGLFALASLAAYAAATRLAIEVLAETLLGCYWFAGSSVGMVVLLFLVQRRFRAAATEDPA